MNSKAIKWCADYLEQHGEGRDYKCAIEELRRCSDMFKKYEENEPKPPKSRIIPESEA